MNRTPIVITILSALGLVGCGAASSVAPSRVLTASIETGTSGTEQAFARPVASSTEIMAARGELDLQGSAGSLTLYGSRGFEFQGQMSVGAGVVQADVACDGTAGCTPGARIPLGAAWSSGDLTGSAALDGIQYSNVGSADANAWASVAFDASVVAPPLTQRGRQTVVADFTMTGQFVHVTNGEAVSDTLRGAGVVKVTLVRVDQGWFVERVVYQFKH